MRQNTETSIFCKISTTLAKTRARVEVCFILYYLFYSRTLQVSF